MTTLSPVRDRQPWLWGARGAALASVLLLALLYVTAGQYIQSDRFEDIHGTGSLALHVSTGLLAASLLMHSLHSRRHRAVAVAAVALFGLTFVQAYFGSGSTLFVHIPLALVTTIGIVFFTVWSVVGHRAAPRSGDVVGG